MLVLAGGGIGPAAVAEFELALVEVFLELLPFLRGCRPVFGPWALFPAAGQVGLVVADDVFFEHGDIPAGDFQVQVAKKRSADVDRQPVVDQVGGEQARSRAK